MPVKIANKEDDQSIRVQQMKDGQIAQITSWAGRTEHMGKIVQRFGSIVIWIGAGEGQHWSTVLSSKEKDLRVRILPKGTLLEIV